MIAQKRLEIQDFIDFLSQEEQKRMLGKITRKINLNMQFNNRFSNPDELEKRIKEMANAPEIQTEIAAINQEFLITEMDGLSDLWQLDEEKFILLILLKQPFVIV